jgi:hypothetical protein
LKKKHSNHKCLDVDNPLLFFIIAKNMPLNLNGVFAIDDWSLGWVAVNKM